MNRSFFALVMVAVFAAGAFAQGSKYTPIESGPSDPEALKKLAAMLGAGGQTSDDQKMMDLFKKWFKDTENDPQARQRMIDLARKQQQENPQQFQNDLKKNNPDLNDDDVKKFAQGLGKPGDPPPQLPKPAEPPKPITPKPVGPGDPPIAQPIDPQTGLPKPMPLQGQPKPPQANTEQVQGAVQMWEQTVGPIDSTPAVKDAIVDLFGNGSGGSGANGKPFWDSPEFGGGSSSSSSQSGFWKFFNGSGSSSGGGSSWTSPSWLKNMNSPKPSTPSAPKTNLNAPKFGGFGSMGGGGIAGLGGAGTVILILIAAVFIGFLIWKFLPMIKEARNRKLQPLPGLGPWPVDPRTIRDRESLVAAFEYLSILVCGNGAVVWNHMTIAEALSDALPDREHLAEPLARLYAIARYTPIREEIPESAYSEARRCLCALAGVSAG